MVKVKLVAALAIEFRLILIEVEEAIKQADKIPDVVNEHVDDAMLMEVYAGNVIITYEPEINLFTDTNHKSYDVTLPMFSIWGLTSLWVIVEAVAAT